MNTKYEPKFVITLGLKRYWSENYSAALFLYELLAIDAGQPCVAMHQVMPDGSLSTVKSNSNLFF